MKLKKKILSVLTCTLMAIGGLGTGKSFADTKSVDIADRGVYQIESALMSNAVVDKNSKNNVELKRDGKQQWIFEYNEQKDGYRIFQYDNINEELVASAWGNNLANAITANRIETREDYWKIEDAGNGYVYFRQPRFNLYLDVENAGTASGTNIQLVKKNGSNAQRFKLYQEDYKIYEGVYQIESALAKGLVVDKDSNSDNVQLWRDGNQKWRFVFDKSKGSYRIFNYDNENEVMAWIGAYPDVKAMVSTGWGPEYWIPEDAGNGYIYLRNFQNKNYYLDVDHSGTASGTNIQVYRFNGSDAQKFKLKKQEELIGDNVIGNKADVRVCPYDQKWAMYVSGSEVGFSSTTLGDQMIFDYDNIKKAYTIRNNYRYLTNEGNSVSMSTNNNTNNQYWIIEYRRKNDVNSSVYTFRNKDTGKYLTRPSGGKKLAMSDYYNSIWDQTYVLLGN